MSDSERPDQVAFRELETLVRHLTTELATFRKRALTAEARVRKVEGRGDDASAGSAVDRLEELEQQNAALDRRLVQARERAEQMLERVRFLRQQARVGATR